MSQAFCLFPAPVAPSSHTSALALPELGSAYLVLAGAGSPRVSTSPPQPDQIHAVLSPVRHQHRPYLVLLAPAAARARVNGWPALPVSVLRAPDRLEFIGEHSFQVSLHVQPYRGLPRDDHLGKECALCLTPVEAAPDGSARVYECPGCSAVLHEHARLEGDAAPLECLQLVSSCPVCRQPIARSEGYAHVPES
jgi:hypothetical protein